MMLGPYGQLSIMETDIPINFLGLLTLVDCIVEQNPSCSRTSPSLLFEKFFSTILSSTTYVCHTCERLYAVSMVLSNVVARVRFYPFLGEPYLSSL